MYLPNTAHFTKKKFPSQKGNFSNFAAQKLIEGKICSKDKKMSALK
jgi:hypothetical protein